MNIWTKLRNMITRGVVNSRDNAGTYQVSWSGDRASAGVEYKEPQGVHFALPADADGITLAPFGDRSGAVLADAQGVLPTGAIAAGEGGLHYLGEWKVFLAADGTLAISAKAPSDWVALASKVDSEFSRVKSDIQGIVTAIEGGVPTPMDGGAALLLSIVSGLAGLPSNPASVASAKVKVG